MNRRHRYLLRALLGPAALLLAAGIAYGRLPGIDVGLLAFAAGAIAQWLWLRVRAKPALAALR